MSSYFLGGFSANLIVPSGRIVEPVRMLVGPRMIGRPLERDIEGDLHPVLGASGYEMGEIFDCAELRSMAS